MSWSEDQFEGYRAFSTKIWNAARFIFRNIEESDRLLSIEELRRCDLTLADRWILSRLARAVQEANNAVEQYNLHEASRTIYLFFWHEFCDWYLEMTKLHPERSKATLIFVFESALRLLHPFMPFITEELWQQIPHTGESIVIAPYPEFDASLAVFVDDKAEYDAVMVQDVISAARTQRSEKNVPAKQTAPVRVASPESEKLDILFSQKDYILKLAQASEVELVSELLDRNLAFVVTTAGCAVQVLADLPIDVGAERSRLSKELEKVRKEIDGLDRKLSNASFVERAPAEVVAENRQRLADYRDQAAKLTAGMERLN